MLYNIIYYVYYICVLVFEHPTSISPGRRLDVFRLAAPVVGAANVASVHLHLAHQPGMMTIPWIEMVIKSPFEIVMSIL